MRAMYVRLYELGEEGGSGGRTVFDGWFPEDTDEGEIVDAVRKWVPDDAETEERYVVELLKDGGPEGAAERKPEYLSIDGSVREAPDNGALTGLGEGYLMVVLLPGKRPFLARIRDSLPELQKCVDGYIEITYPFDDNCLVIGNDEAKLIGMKGNRRINGEIYAGPLLLAGDDCCGGFCDLTDTQIKKYMERFGEPEAISDEEVDGSIKIEVYAI